MMTLTLTPELERRLTAYAKHKQKPVERVIEEWVEKLPDEATAVFDGKAYDEEEANEEYAKPVSLQEQFASEEELEQWFDEFAEIGKGKGYLPDSAFDRENLYEERI